MKRSKVRCVPYDFRHTFATRAAESGMDLATLAAIRGHATLRSVMKYIHIGQTRMDASIANLDLPTVEAQAARPKEVVN